MSYSTADNRLDWRQFFKEAVLEVDPNRFPIKLEAAHKAVLDRQEELRRENGGTAASGWNWRTRSARFSC